MEQPESQNPQKQPSSSFRGLYRHVKISVKTLDIVILGGLARIVALLIFGVAHNGYTVTFDSKGGTDVPPQTGVMYGDLVEAPEPPTREGYQFTGWFSDENCTNAWDMETTQVTGSITLYAGWE